MPNISQMGARPYWSAPPTLLLAPGAWSMFLVLWPSLCPEWEMDHQMHPVPLVKGSTSPSHGEKNLLQSPTLSRAGMSLVKYLTASYSALGIVTTAAVALGEA